MTSSSDNILGNPPLNPPSLSASIIKATIAGPDDVSAKNISRYSSVNSYTLLVFSNRFFVTCFSSLVIFSPQAIPVKPYPTVIGILVTILAIL